jgi:hypothetical protein
MQKIISLAKKGWQFSVMCDNQGWFRAEFTHNTWGDGQGYSQTLSQSINQAYEEAIALTKMYSY